MAKPNDKPIILHLVVGFQLTFLHLVPSTAVFQKVRLPFLADHWFSFSVPSTPTKTPMVKKIPPVPPQFWFSPSGTDYEFHLFIKKKFRAQTNGSCHPNRARELQRPWCFLPQKLATYFGVHTYLLSKKSQCHPIFPEYLLEIQGGKMTNKERCDHHQIITISLCKRKSSLEVRCSWMLHWRQGSAKGVDQQTRLEPNYLVGLFIESLSSV